MLAVIIVIVLIVVRPGSGAPSADPKDTTKPSSAATGTPQTPAATDPAVSTGDAKACDPKSIKVVALTDSQSYGDDKFPMLALSVTNTGKTACAMPVGSDVQEYQITSGDELIWSSKHCQKDPVAQERVLEPNASLKSTPFAWNRTRSDANGCGDDPVKVTADGASYHLAVIVDGIKAAETRQFLLK